MALLKKFVECIPWRTLPIYFVLMMVWSYFGEHRGFTWVDSIVATIVFGVIYAIVEFIVRRWKARRSNQ